MNRFSLVYEEKHKQIQIKLNPTSVHFELGRDLDLNSAELRYEGRVINILKFNRDAFVNLSANFSAVVIHQLSAFDEIFGRNRWENVYSH